MASDRPTFTTRTALLEWAREIAANAMTKREQIRAIDTIRSVTLAHMHLEDE